jgi:peptidoglycan/LPS O-acetylase OafA/YrhL
MREIKAHTGLRGIAAFSVFLGHAEFDRIWHASSWWLLPYRLFYWQNPAVDLFFMLSGFVLNYVYVKQRRLEWGDYISARLARICPLYYAGMAAMLAMNYFAAFYGHAPSGNLQEPIIVRNLMMIQEWPIGGAVTSIDTAAWSISVEMFLYLIAFPVLAILFACRRISSFFLLPILFALLTMDSLISSENIFGIDLPYAHLLRGIVGFAAGFLICELIYERNRAVLGRRGELVLTVATVAAFPFVTFHMILPFAFAGLIATTYPEKSWLGQKLSVPVLSYLGAISYSVYIWHLPVIKAATLAFGVRQMGAGGISRNISHVHLLLYCGGTIGAVLVISTVSYYWFESPLRRIFRKRNHGRALLAGEPGV